MLTEVEARERIRKYARPGTPTLGEALVQARAATASDETTAALVEHAAHVAGVVS